MTKDRPKAGNRPDTRFNLNRRRGAALWGLSLVFLWIGSLPVQASPASAGKTSALFDAPGAWAVITPPLSIDESCQLIKETLKILGDSGHASRQARINLADRTLQTVMAYVERVDRAHPTLPSYAWVAVATHKAPKTGWGTLTFKMKQPIPHVTALGLMTHHEDVEIKYLAAIDQNKTKWEFNRSYVVPAEQPRPEICFLPLPTRLAEIQMICRRLEPGSRHWARLFIDAGICPIPESAKQANYFLKTARYDLQQRNLEAATQHIQRAYALLRIYRKTRRL